MAIIYHQKDRTFTLHTKETTYQMQVDRYGFLLHLYYGRRAAGCMDYLLTYADRGFSGNPYDAQADRTYSMDVLPQEFPSSGTGDYRSTALSVKNTDGSFSTDLRFEKYTVYKGKYGLAGLPAAYAGGDEAETLEIILRDKVTGLKAVLMYGVIDEKDVITRSVKIINEGPGKVFINKVQSACLDFVSGNWEAVSLYGRHAMERNFQRIPVAHGNFSIGSRRGTSSHQYSPMLIMAEAKTSEDFGDCYALSFVYSGGFQAAAERDQFNQTRVLMGIQEEQFCYPLEPGEEFYAPEVLLSYTHMGLNRLSQNLHRCIRENICRGKYKDEARPVLVNSWEAAYFDFTGATLYQLAEKAKAADIEMLVLDDGWFGKRNDDNSGLGDWYVNEEKLGCTLGELTDRINGLGIKFGIWVEPEMISADSDLYRAHPDWALVIPGRNPVRARNQLVLDFSKSEVVDYIFTSICGILDQGNIEYVKWDMNRSLCDIYSADIIDQGMVLYDYVLGLYNFLERMTKRYPNLLIEGCSGGGGRFDAGMLYYTPQIWCSDNTDAIDRVRIQYGTSFGFPVSTVGAHVSAVPNHQTGRITSLNTRAVTAMAGTFGYELNLGDLSGDEIKEIRQQVKAYHAYESLIRNGRYYRLSNPVETEYGAWAFVSEDKSEALLNVVMLENHGNMPVSYVKMSGLEEAAIYRDEESGRKYSGTALMQAGIPMPLQPGEYQAYQLHFRQA